MSSDGEWCLVMVSDSSDGDWFSDGEWGLVMVNDV